MIDKLITIGVYVMWTLFILGVLIITFTNFQYPDLNFFVSVAFFFTILNTFFRTQKIK